MAKFFPWKQHFALNSTHDDENPSVAIHDGAPENEADGNKRTMGGRSLSRATKLGLALISLTVTIVVGIAVGRSSHNFINNSAQKKEGLQNSAPMIIGGEEVSVSCL